MSDPLTSPEAPSLPLDTTSTSRRGSRTTSAALPDIMKKINGLYYFNQRVYDGDTPGKINYRHVNYVFYAFAFAREDGTVYLSDERADKQISADGVGGCLESLRRLQLHFPHLTLILSLGGGGFSSDLFARVAADTGKREHFARSARALVDEIRFNGIDIDWELPSDKKQGQDYIALLSTLRAQLPAPQYKLTSALPCAEWALRNIDVRKADEYLDLMNVMAYDFTSTARAGHHAQLFGQPGEGSGAAGVTYLTNNGFSPSKILLGIPCYGRSFLGANAAGQDSRGSGGNEGTFEYKNLPRPGTQEQVDRQAVAAFCIGGDGGFVSYDNAETVRMKADFVKARGLAGLFYWTGTGDKQDDHSVMTAGFRSLHNA